MQSCFLIFSHFLCLDTWVNIWTFCFASESLQLICLCDVNQRYYMIYYWFPHHLLYIDHGNTKFSYIYTTEMRQSSLWKTSKWNARLIYTINKNNNKTNNKNQARITKTFEKTLLSERILSIAAKILLLYTFNNISFNFFKFCWFEQSINTLKFKVFASKGCCFCSLLLQFKILAILYFYRFIIIFNLALQQVLLVIELTKVEIFVSKCMIPLFHLHLKIYNKNSLWRKSILQRNLNFRKKFYKLKA